MSRILFFNSLKNKRSVTSNSIVTNSSYLNKSKVKVEINYIKYDELNLAMELIEIQNREKLHKDNPNRKLIGDLLLDENYIMIVAQEGTKVIGGLTAYKLKMLDGNCCKILLYEIDVLSEYRRQGVGSKLIKKLDEIGTSIQSKSIFLVTEITNTAAQKFYKNIGGEKHPQIMYVFKNSQTKKNKKRVL